MGNGHSSSSFRATDDDEPLGRGRRRGRGDANENHRNEKKKKKKATTEYEEEEEEEEEEEDRGRTSFASFSPFGSMSLSRSRWATEDTTSDDDGFVVAEPFQLTNEMVRLRDERKRDERRDGEGEKKTRDDKRILECKGVVGKERGVRDGGLFWKRTRVELLGCRVGQRGVSSVLRTTTRAVQDIFF